MLETEWQGLRIAHLSDFHVGGPGTDIATLREALRVSRQFRPDVVALTGDYFDEEAKRYDWSLFDSLPADIPIVAVIGNHDHRHGSQYLQKLESELNRRGVEILQNSTLAVELNGRKAWIAGVDDPHSRRDDLREALDIIPPDADAPLLLLSHSPSIVNDLGPGEARIVLAGHTHGGQIRLTPSGRIPLIQMVRRLKGLRPQPPLPLARGYHWWRGAIVIISDGLGLSTIPLRFRTRPQVVLIELDAAPADGPPCDDIDRYVDVISGPW